MKMMKFCDDSPEWIMRDIVQDIFYIDSFQLLVDLERDYILIINVDTQITSKTSTRIDLIFTNCSDLNRGQLNQV